jgi:hypothetical protein
MRILRRCGNGLVIEASKPVGKTEEQLEPSEQLELPGCDVPPVSDRDGSV